MKFGIRGGHTQASTGAANLLNELTEDRLIYNEVKRLLKSNGQTVVDITPPEDYGYPAELNYGINLANKSGLDFGLSIHLNAGGGQGCEVIVHDQARQSTVDTANRILDKLSSLGFTNRGIKRSPSSRKLGEITQTTCSFIIVEVCFVDSSTDSNIMHLVGEMGVARAITEGLLGHTIQSSVEEEEEMKLPVAVVMFTKEDFWAAMDVAVKNGNCAMFVRNEDHTLPKDAAEATKVIVVGGPTTNHPNETLLSGNDKYETAAAVKKYLG
jgi:hypothetical protein